ncbi:TonB-dependent receptor [Woodsholea maritima]|uniref:TonB-dependent receptor n=1 Tax=Woodsholea maritima TaxID=240237 RepID=UPI000379D87B|nr:TonB-dependent receptor [Woodsholea maritima]
MKSMKNVLMSTSMCVGMGVVAAMGAVPAFSASAMAQSYTTGVLTGNVSDDNGNALDTATVTIISLDRGFSRTSGVNSSGSFRFAELQSGSYQVVISAPGKVRTQDNVSIRPGQETSFNFELRALSDGEDDTIIVVGQAIQGLVFSQTTTGLQVDVAETIKQVPLDFSLTSVTLLAPTVNVGDSAFGNQPSIGGSSVAENAFYVNGLNVTDFNNYIGGSELPFYFYESVEVKTGGYPAEFGRATGGVVTAVTKSGSNDFMLALHANWAPSSLREQSADTPARANRLYEEDDTSFVIEAGGPIIKDRLFFYGLYEINDQETRTFASQATQTYVETTDDPQYGFKVDGYITDDHHVEFTYFDTSSDTTRSTYKFYNDSGQTLYNLEPGTTVFANGGSSYIARYTGSFTDWLTVSAAYGRNKDSSSTDGGDTLRVGDYTGKFESPEGVFESLNSQSISTESEVETEREFYRADVDIEFEFMGSHNVRFGYDLEKLHLKSIRSRIGQDDAAYYYYTARTDEDDRVTAPNMADGDEYVELNIFRSGGEIRGENTAYYIQDAWDVTSQLSLMLGLRYDQFTVNNVVGDALVEFDGEIGPRLGFNYDLFGDGQTKVRGSFGRYYLPTATNTAARMGSYELYMSQYFKDPNGDGVWSADEMDDKGVPLSLGDQIVDWDGARSCPAGGPAATGSNGCRVTGDGSLKDTTSQISRSLQSTYEDEYILGVDHQLNDDWTVGATFFYRSLGRLSEDSAIDAAVIAYCEENGYALKTAAKDGCADIWGGFHQYVIHNPGEDMKVILSDPLPGETELREVSLSAQALGYPDVKREYIGVEFSFDRAFDGVWGLRGSYVLSESRGNAEGQVISTIGQTDAGITQDWDQPGLMDGADGLLPNHRAHQFKVFGSYQLTENVLIGTNISVISPRKFGCLGFHPTDTFARAYRAASWFCDGKPTPRGTQFESDWIKQIDFSVRYDVPIEFAGSELTLRADIFNAFNFKGAMDLNEFGESPNGSANPDYRKVQSYQEPRYIRLGFDLTF